MSNQLYYYGFDFPTFVLLSILLYLGVIILIVAVRYCIVNNVCQKLRCSRSGDSSRSCCNKCKRRETKTSCLGCYREFSCKCFRPTFSHFYCCCCEIIFCSSKIADLDIVEREAMGDYVCIESLEEIV